MKSKFFLIVLAFVIVVHGLIFLFPFEKEDENQNPGEKDSSATQSPSEVVSEEGSTVAPITEKQDGTSEASGDNNEKPVERAVALVKKANASTPRPRPDKPLSPSVETSKAGDSIRVGIVTGNSKLSPELKDLATEGAKAVASQDWKTARQIYLEMVQKAPDNALAYANLGVSEHQLGNLLAAAGNLRKSLEINPSIAQNWQTLGLIHFERRELEMAISHLTRAIHEDPSNAHSRMYLAAVVREYGWNDAAITELQRAVETDPKLVDAHYNLAVSYLEITPPRIELARRHYYSAIDLGAEPSPEIESALKSPPAAETSP